MWAHRKIPVVFNCGQKISLIYGGRSSRIYLSLSSEMRSGVFAFDQHSANTFHEYTAKVWKVPTLKWVSSTVIRSFRGRCSQNIQYISSDSLRSSYSVKHRCWQSSPTYQLNFPVDLGYVNAGRTIIKGGGLINPPPFIMLHAFLSI